MKRELSIEVYRCLLMFGICLLHAITMGGHHTNNWMSAPLLSCVNGFIFISGYYGIKFKPSKLLGLYITGFVCCCIAVGLTAWKFSSFEIQCGWEYVDAVWKLFSQSCWFLHAYAFLMFLAPLANFVMEIDKDRLKHVVIPLLILCFGWSYFIQMPIIRRYPMPSTPGLGEYSGVTLLGIYVVGRICRRFEIGTKVSKLGLFWIAIISICFSWLGFAAYNCVFTLALAFVGFCLFKRWHPTKCMESFLSTICTFLRPSLFSIYLLHSHSMTSIWLHRIEDELYLHISCGVYLLTAIIVFSGCLMLDIPRRLIFYLFRVLYNNYVARRVFTQRRDRGDIK